MHTNIAQTWCYGPLFLMQKHPDKCHQHSGIAMLTAVVHNFDTAKTQDKYSHTCYIHRCLLIKPIHAAMVHSFECKNTQTDDTNIVAHSYCFGPLF